MKRPVIILILIALIATLLVACDESEEQTPAPVAPDITLDSGYSQSDLELAVANAGGGCDIGTETIVDNGDGTWSVGVWEFEYIHQDGNDNGSKFWEIGITDPIEGNPQALDVDCTDFEIHVLYKNTDEYYAVTVFEYIP